MNQAIEAPKLGVLEPANLSPATPADNMRLGIFIFLSSECAFFASLIGTYLALHGRSVGGPHPRQVLDLTLAGGATLDLLVSSLTAVLAVYAAHAGRFGRMRLWLGLTALLGIAFVSSEIYEWIGFYHRGLQLSTNVFGASFYVLTGFHGLHVTFGVTWLVALLIWSLRREMNPQQVTRVEAASLYWHFVDVVWVVIFTVVYMMGVA